MLKRIFILVLIVISLCNFAEAASVRIEAQGIKKCGTTQNEDMFFIYESENKVYVIMHGGKDGTTYTGSTNIDISVKKIFEKAGYHSEKPVIVICCYMGIWKTWAFTFPCCHMQMNILCLCISLSRSSPDIE